MTIKPSLTNSVTPKILGAGLVCLDIIKDFDSISYLNGGSCGNVTAALSFMGWNSSVITKRYEGTAGRIINENLVNSEVSQIAVGKKTIEAPMIIEELISKKGIYLKHKFLMTCAECGQDLPKVSLFDKQSITMVLEKSKEFDILYTDRSSPGISLLKEFFNKNNNWTVYEPNSARNIKAFMKNSLNSKIVKFSADKISFKVAEKLRSNADESATVLIVHTNGENGLQFCYRKKNNKISNWVHLNPQPVLKLVDTTGAGDWCTTGLINVLVGNNRKSKKWLSKNEVISALQYGQALAAISCSFIGAQGLIYADSKKYSNNLLNIIKRSRKKEIKPAHIPRQSSYQLCRTCLREKKTIKTLKIG
ncbi:MAG: hypothetical protein KAI40_08710 [Desulfobacterales bacterium]|nr:hypothetical protein [Desulfobacterales bacterium]